MYKFNWREVEAVQEGGIAKPPAGGYVLVIRDVVDIPEKEFLKISYDIIDVADPANQQFIGYYSNRNYLPIMCRSYKESARGFFKSFLKALEGSNSFEADDFDGNEKNFIGMIVGAVMGEEEYIYNDKLRTRLKPVALLPVQKIKEGDFKIPEIKKLDQPAVAAAPVVNNEYLPF